MTPTRYLVATEVHGKETYERFDDTPSSELLPDAAITKITVAYNSYNISGIEVRPQEPDFGCVYTNFPFKVHYATDDPKPIRRGGFSDSVVNYTLQPSEYVTAIEGSYEGDRIRHLTFVTNKRT